MTEKHNDADGGASSADGGFASLGLGPRVLAAVERAGFEEPSEIQREFIPAVLTGRDCIGRARTGTGKTAAFLLPIFEHFFRGQLDRVLILAPTRELAQQICAESRMLSGKRPPGTTAVYGGQPIKRQIEHLRNNPEIVVATPGRVIDHYKRHTISFSHFTTVVLDEVDRMFDMGFRKDIRYILKNCTRRRQTLFLSATLPKEIMRLAEQHTTDPIRISAVDKGPATVSTMEQRYFAVARPRKLPLLKALLDREDPALALIFARTKAMTDKLGKILRDEGLPVRHIHGDMPQTKRDRALQQFREGKVKLLVATDVMGRGIDVPNVSHVINYDIPENPEDYLHRIGRSARMNAQGKAFTFVEPTEGEQLTSVEMLCNTLIEPDAIEGFDSGVKRRGR